MTSLRHWLTVSKPLKHWMLEMVNQINLFFMAIAFQGLETDVDDHVKMIGHCEFLTTAIADEKSPSTQTDARTSTTEFSTFRQRFFASVCGPI